MQTKAASKESSNSASRAFFSARASSPSFFNSMIQAKCTACENEDKVQRKEDPTLDAPDLAVQAKSEPSPAITTVQAQCGACAESGIKLQPTDVNLDNLDSVAKILNFVSKAQAA